MMDDIDYRDFVYNISSEVSRGNLIHLRDRLSELELANENMKDYPSNAFIPHLLTASLGLSGETGEFNDHVKKLLFHNKGLTQERKDAMVKELGDVMWYVMQACIALDVDLSYVVAQNMAKLRERHGGTEFKENYSSDSEK